MTHFIPVSDIVIRKNRQRREFNPADLNELRESIEALGLLQMPVCRREGDEVVLVAGERRLRAVIDLYELGGVLTFGSSAAGAKTTAPYGTIPYNDIGELTELEAMEAELDENIKRSDLTWPERCAAIAQLSELRTGQAKLKGLPAPTSADLAREIHSGALDHKEDGELGNQQADVRKAIILSKHLNDPDIAGAKNVRDAFKVLQRKETRARDAELGASMGSGMVAAGHRIIQGSCVTWAAAQPDGQYQVIITDPPYGMGADEFGDSNRAGSLGEHFYADTEQNFVTLMDDIVPETYRLAAEQAHLYMFCDIGWFGFLKERLGNAGWRVFRTPLIWFAPSKFRAPWPEHGPQRKYETILYAVKGDRKCNKLGGDVLQFPPDDNLGHQAQKPVALFEELLKRSARPGDKVLDLFGGTGTLLPAAQNTKCFATIVEQDAAACGIAAARLNKLKGL